MEEPNTFHMNQPLSPIASVGMVTFTSTPTSSTPDINANSEPHKSSQTPMKNMGHLYYGQQYKTPSISSPGWIGLAQSSPCTKTPGSSSSGSRIPNLPHFRTPSSNPSSKKGTPNLHTPDQPYNPFDSNLLEKLDGSLFSPNVFADVQSAQQTPKSFQWTIDELAILRPADIEEFPNQPDAIQADLDLEKRAQEVIDAYFANNLIAPSPWSSVGSKKNLVLPATPRTPASFSSAESPLTFGERNTPAVVKSTKRSVCDAACQTALSLPVNFNIEKVLENSKMAVLLRGEYFTYNKEGTVEDSGTQDMLSMSSLRRKLFFHGEDASPPSPVKSNECEDGRSMDYDPSPVMSPVKQINQTPKQSHHTPMEIRTPSSAHFSSSPISLSHGNALTPFLRRCSTAPDIIESPGVSPIVSSHSPQSHMSTAVTPISHQLQATPGSGHIIEPLESPGMSPIVKQDGGFTRKSRLHACSEKIQVPEELRLSLEKTKEMEEASFLHMDLGTEDSQRAVDNLSFVSSQEDNFMKARHYSMSDTQYSDDEVSNQDNFQTYYISQDTGYNTNSLQLTNNPEPGLHSAMNTQNETSMHTDLTHQFGSLPFTSLSSQSVEGSTIPFVKQAPKKAFVRHLAPRSVSNNQKNCHGLDEVLLNEREVRHRAKRILGKSISMDDSQLGASLDSAMLRPYLLNAVGVPAFNMSSPESAHRNPSPTGEKVLPSELASHVLHKAGEDLRKYCDEHLSDNNTRNNELGSDIHLAHVNSQSRPNQSIIMSAEF